MKVIVTGATGFVGSEVLEQLLARQDISQVTCLVRRSVTLRVLQAYSRNPRGTS